MSITPIKPSEVFEAKRNSLPDFVLIAFNALITEQWDGARSVVHQKAVVARIIEESRGTTTPGQIFEKKWLEVEDIYRKEGWEVKYDKSGWDESYDAFFVFSKKKNR